ncbi:hypothetical protein D0T84_14085 [Dysgonomonas sp. 521]|uniref:hypothetical protein n=1 Tax=Dysgonomonas sp. 521 TaxID=2302932 RepID=UPI0013CFC994|nr:hypothetical protein [Dysgonomonas sp. 521]NDV96033.1 hypothetical protein [Dysgonomonas sp. 521]
MKPHQQTLFKEYPTYEDLQKELSPERLIVAFAGIEYIEQSISKKRVSLADIDELYSTSNKNRAVEYIKDWLSYLAKFIGVKPLIESSAAAYMLYKSHKHLYLADLKLLLEKISQAEYGKESMFYGCMNTQSIYFSFSVYNQERNRIANKFYQKLEENFAKIKEETEAKEKQRIYNEVAGLYEDKELWELYQERCREEIPGIIRAKWEEFINNQSDGNQQK